MHRVELKGPKTVEDRDDAVLFLMHRVELKARKAFKEDSKVSSFLMHRVELKDGLALYIQRGP